MILDRKDDRVVIFGVFQIFVDGLNRAAEWDRLAKPFPFNGMSYDGLITSHVMNVEFNTFDSFFEVFNVSGNLTITCNLVTSQISVVRTETEIISQW